MKEGQWILSAAFAFGGLISPWASEPWRGFLAVTLGYVGVWWLTYVHREGSADDRI